MTLDEIKIVHASFNRLNLIPAKLGKAFYDRLFQAAPCVRNLFPGDMQSMELKIVDMLDYIVLHIDKPEALEASVTDLAVRHKEYGAMPEHYAVVGKALLETIADYSPGGLTQAEEEAWTSVYGFVSEIMIEETTPKVA